MHKVVLFVCLSGIISASSWAENIIRPGLWELTTQSDLLTLVPHIPSQQMQQINQLAKKYGLEIPQIRNGAATANVCITPDMAKQDVPAYFYENQSGCTVQNATRTGNRFEMELMCDNPHFNGSGHAEGIFLTPESFTGRTEFNSMVEGMPLFANADTIGRWVSDRCETTQSAR